VTLTVRPVESRSELADALAVRWTVFVDEQGVPEALERDEYDSVDAATHVVAYDEGTDRDGSGERGTTAVGAARLRPYDDDRERTSAKVERVAVLADRRDEGIGARLMDVLETEAREQRVETLVLHAQKPVEGFYVKRGYRRVGDVFEEAGIPHVEMRRDLC
jgi:predicted GNAT family N-acyltransferase